jgi:hypothetical protein
MAGFKELSKRADGKVAADMSSHFREVRNESGNWEWAIRSREAMRSTKSTLDLILYVGLESS